MLVVFIRTLILYAIVVVGMRLMGKRQLGELQPSELVITILISNIATLPIEDTSVPLLSGAVPILTLMCFEVILSYIAMRSLRLRTFICGTPRIVIREGHIDQQELKTLRYSVDDLMEQLRANGIFDVQEVDMAVVETTGQLSVYKKNSLQPPSAKDLQFPVQPASIPAVVVSSGEIVPAGLQYCGITAEKVRLLAKKEGRDVPDIFLMTCTPDLSVYLVPLDKKNKKKAKNTWKKTREKAGETE